MYNAKPLSFNAMGEGLISLPDGTEGEVQKSTSPLKIPLANTYTFNFSVLELY